MRLFYQYFVIVMIVCFSLIAGCATTECKEYYPNITISKVNERIKPIFFDTNNCNYEIEYEIVNQGLKINDTITFEIKMIDKQTGKEEDSKIISILSLEDYERRRGIETFKGKCLRKYEFNCVIYQSWSCVE